MYLNFIFRINLYLSITISIFVNNILLIYTIIIKFLFKNIYKLKYNYLYFIFSILLRNILNYLYFDYLNLYNIFYTSRIILVKILYLNNEFIYIIYYRKLLKYIILIFI